MIAHILEKPSRVFAGVKYNTNKVDRNTGELMLIANFGILQALSNPRPQDLVNYLLMVSAQNKGIKNTQFHATISARGRNYNKQELTKAAVMWLKEMKYGDQPYLIVFHKDTDNNHVHIVSSRVGKDGKQIDRDYEQVRAVRNINKVLGYSFAMQYRFSTKAQFYLILENQGFLGRDYVEEEKLQKKLNAYVPDKARITEIRSLFNTSKADQDFVQSMRAHYQLDLVFHSAEGKKPYGYTVIDHATKQVFKGSEILNLKYLLNENIHTENTYQLRRIELHDYLGENAITYYSEYAPEPVHISPVMIADDVDDQQVLGMKRRRQKKARTNTR
ncbi:relaxase/mobilization nuclease domain-containing protein [Mucilaginibacter sp. KACC 22773]|uniref:relaxase/mobilization nuclease domain-containing protein n=1 Tax=Mucilaginibacter sp. KACC 22773 TaxID=3025671 RepID=UPI0023669A3B|nr:relaxase/mobilization nuclease domain-containing protein [Mucilaginibacter sp. KACC 22773]WDF77062.1 relaxase/mobilization nuclease domain-containing protein [Mucilaginibacter sp. KACC 22773]